MRRRKSCAGAEERERVRSCPSSPRRCLLLTADADHVSLRPIDVVKPEYRHVFGLLDPRPDSVCTLRPLVYIPAPTPAPTLRPQQSFASISTINSETTLHTDSSPERYIEAHMVYDGDCVTADEASQATRQLLEDLEFTSLQRHLFFKKPEASLIQFPSPPNPSTQDLSTTPTTASPLAFPPTPPTTPPCDTGVLELQRLTAQVTAYWRSCLGRLQEELNRTQKLVERSRTSLGKLKDEVDKRYREGEHENMSAIALWAAHEKLTTKEQSRNRSFTAPSSTAPPRFIDTVGEEGEGEGEGDAFSTSWQPRGYTTDAGENRERLLSSLPSTPVSSNSAFGVSSFFEKEEDAHELALLKKTRRLTSLIKAKLLPHTKRGHGQGHSDEPPPVGARTSYPPTLANSSTVFSHSSASSTLMEDHAVSAPHSIEAEVTPSRHAIDIGSPVVGSPPTTSWSSRSPSYSAPASGQRTSRGALRKAPVVFSRVTAELSRIDEYMHGVRVTVTATLNLSLIESCYVQIYVLFDGLDRDLVHTQELVELTLAPCTSPHPTDDDTESVEEAADAERIKALRTLLHGGLESRVTYALTGLDEVHKWNGLVRSLLRDFKRTLEGGLEDDHEAF